MSHSGLVQASVNPKKRLEEVVLQLQLVVLEHPPGPVVVRHYPVEGP
jgi:hypothetical protein